MAINLETGEHICYGLYIGSGCESCRKKYPHLLARTPEEIARGTEHMRMVSEVLSAAIEQGGIESRHAAAINRLSIGTAVADLPASRTSGVPAVGGRRSAVSLAKLAPGFVQDMLAVPYTAPVRSSRWAGLKDLLGNRLRSALKLS